MLVWIEVEVRSRSGMITWMKSNYVGYLNWVTK
jgi:hypothetical protein